jgi:hypothetical protein
MNSSSRFAMMSMVIVLTCACGDQSAPAPVGGVGSAALDPRPSR